MKHSNYGFMFRVILVGTLYEMRRLTRSNDIAEYQHVY